MSDNDKNQAASAKPDGAVERLALELFSTRTAAMNGRAAKQIAIQCFRDAEVFLATVAEFRAGKLISKEENVWGDEAFAPKLPDNHPVNMISRQKGNRERVNRIAKWLEANPDPNIGYTEGDLSWDVATTRLARVILPQHADKVAAAKN